MSQYKRKSEGSSAILVVSLIVGLSCLLIVGAYFYTNGSAAVTMADSTESQANDVAAKAVSQKEPGKAQKTPKTATLRLPEKTNNVRR